jgi:uncharacterized membrane protein (DUF4010 family)
MNQFAWLPPEAGKILLVLFLSFLIGLEREERKLSVDQYTFGGVRTYPLIGLIGYALALLSGPELLPVALGFAVVGGFLMLSYFHKLSGPGVAGVTSEMSGLITFVIGALVSHEQYWIATTLSVASLALLELKVALEGLAKRIEQSDILTFTKFLVLSVIILPVLPNVEYPPFLINPFKTWLVVVAVSGVSYGSYVLLRLTKGHGGILLAAVLGGAYSSTVTTVAMARRSAAEGQPCLFSGATLIASGMMYLRLAVLLSLFNADLMLALAPWFVSFAIIAIAFGWYWAHRKDADATEIKQEAEPKNPLELSAGFMFALLFLGMLVVTHLAVKYLGSAGVYALAAVMGVSDVDPFIMGMTQEAGKAQTPVSLAADAIVIAAASNNIAKGVYAFSLSPRSTGVKSLALLIGLAVLGLTPLVWRALSLG